MDEKVHRDGGDACAPKSVCAMSPESSRASSTVYLQKFGRQVQLPCETRAGMWRAIVVINDK